MPVTLQCKGGRPEMLFPSCNFDGKKKAENYWHYSSLPELHKTWTGLSDITHWFLMEHHKAKLWQWL